MDAMPNRSDAELSRDVAQEAGRLLLDLRASFGPVDDKDAANALRKLADRTSHERIMELLTAARPHDAILSEEGKDDDSRLSAERVWIVDPLDGTFEYGQGRADFAVHIALWEPASRTLSATALARPAGRASGAPATSIFSVMRSLAISPSTTTAASATRARVAVMTTSTSGTWSNRSQRRSTVAGRRQRPKGGNKRTFLR